ncbi:hypothetical protein [Haliea sp. E17]|uniref:cadherin repeat domain-containing protein n=1 Tax=Haliea sp. E17 TaxID=3401576 RepID=UPI003AAD9E0C
MRFDAKTFSMIRKRGSQIGLLALSSLVLVNCSCKQEPGNVDLSCVPSKCTPGDDSCSITVEFLDHSVALAPDPYFEDNEFISMSPMGKDNYTSKTSIKKHPEFESEHAYYRYVFTFDPAEAVDGVYKYAAKVRGKVTPPYSGSIKVETCAGEITLGEALGSLRVAVESTSVSVEPETGPELLPDYVASGAFIPPVTATWTSSNPDWVVSEDSATGKPAIAYVGNAEVGTYNADVLKLTVTATMNDGSEQTVVIPVSGFYGSFFAPGSRVVANVQYALAGDEVTLFYEPTYDNQLEYSEETATWSLSYTSSEGVTSDIIDAFNDGAEENVRTFIAQNPGIYTASVLREYYYVYKGVGVTPELASQTLSTSVETLAPAVYVTYRPIAETINIGEPVVFDASGSTLPPGSEIVWEILSQPAGGAAVILPEPGNSRVATLTPDVVEGEYQVMAELRVPFREATYSEVVTFSFLSAPVAGPATQQSSFTAGDTVPLGLDGSTYPSGSTFEYTLVAAPEGSAAEITASPNGTGSLVTDLEGMYEVRLTITNNEGEVSDYTTLLTVTAGAVPGAPPVFTAASVAVSVDENSINTGYTAAANDADGDVLTYAISGGADQSSFSLEGGELLFLVAPDYEAPADSNADNVYEVEVTVTDDSADMFSASQQVLVTVNDVDESQAVALDVMSALPVVDNDGSTDEVIVIDIDTSERMVANAAVSGVGPNTALVLYGNYTGGANTANVYDSSGNPFALVNFANGAVLNANSSHKIQLQRDDGDYYQVILSFQASGAVGDMTLVNLSGHNCGPVLSDCP